VAFGDDTASLPSMDAEDIDFPFGAEANQLAAWARPAHARAQQLSFHAYGRHVEHQRRTREQTAPHVANAAAHR
jgi:hypothetical protein